jgi:hypothetical protein
MGSPESVKPAGACGIRRLSRPFFVVLETHRDLGADQGHDILQGLRADIDG